MTNFDYLKKEDEFKDFIDVAIIAEKTFSIDVGTCIFNCRRAVETAIRWMYSVDKDLHVPYQDNLYSLMSTEDFKDIVDSDLWRRLDYIRKCGNEVAHSSKIKTGAVAKLCLQNLFYFTDFIACCYGKEYEEKEYDESLLMSDNKDVVESDVKEKELETLIKENESLKAELSARRASQQPEYVPKPLDLSEYKTRKLYIDAMLVDAGWTEGKDWINEVEIPGMPNNSEIGFADYVLYDDAHRPLAVIEAKRTCHDVSKGRQQGKLYCDLLQKKYKRRPILFLTNGFETRIDDNWYPERKVSSFYSKRDLEKLFNLQTEKSHLTYIDINENIAGRYYQKAAIKAVCEAFDKKRKRRALLVMATGSGKTRTVIGLVDVLLKNGWIKNVLFLADRNSLVTQAKRSFVNLLPNVSCTNLVEDKSDYDARIVFSTYQTLMGCIDSVKVEEQKLFTCGHFDLIICDEAHRSVYNKYKDIFTYFDAPLVGLTATPKDEIEKNTYEIFDLENKTPTYGYELKQAVDDGYLVDFKSVETELKFLTEGIVYNDLSEEEKEEYENTFVDENGNYPDKISSSKLNAWVFNEDTIKQVLRVLFENGIHVDYGQKIGKTIIFAKNHKHAEKILEVFNKEYPHLKDYAKVVDNYINYSQSLIDEFSDANKMPQIAISVDMLDTGIDVPEVVNLVFFKKVMSKAKFWQMIGRGTRLCPELLDGKDKKEFYIFDFCGNFEFFRMNKEKASKNGESVQSSIFNLEFEIAYKLQDLAYQTDELKEWRKTLVNEMVEKVSELNKNSFNVRQHIKYVDLYLNPDNYNTLTYEDVLNVKEELSPLMNPIEDEINAIRFDALMYGIELAYLANKKYYKARNDLIKKVSGVSKVANIPEIQVQSEFIKKILLDNYLDSCGINEFEDIRERLRELIKYIPKDGRTYETNFEDDILSSEWHESELDSDALENYREKIEHYIHQHEQDNPAIIKLRENKPLNKEDIENLESVLWKELGTQEDYFSEVGNKGLGEFVREIVGLDRDVVNEAFAKYIDERGLNSNQIYFVKKIIDFIAMHGTISDMSVLQDSPFTDQGDVGELFGNDMELWSEIHNTIKAINNNAKC